MCRCGMAEPLRLPLGKMPEPECESQPWEREKLTCTWHKPQIRPGLGPYAETLDEKRKPGIYRAALCRCQPDISFFMQMSSM